MEQTVQDEQMQLIVQRLHKLQHDLSEEIDGLREMLAQVGGDREQFDTSERSDALQQRNMAKANVTLSERRLRLVEAALRRIAEGDEDFGYCRSCDAEIPFARLSVRPESPLCLNCQQQQEVR
ncbi:TraR/DksA family transcriptional regulator [Marinobacterium rhizophilum]|uniref:TraR/DksA family transcriptional regulator n=1 Tax=Marinobacterium rhizophilum TaxID=420402 RepID=A0ABY5HRB3_9GAMM|nr:TraR/DksA family transcriptional regulator [Marinobacterium rhizophilum]UTW13744.1 TraR/DksA family transcriptional regulator [Marinobacterium rhizophilum]